ncbi:hypothetical protein WICMUC_003261 [Wickerhamomyces mucosus]|uniref:Condensin complex subunit 2 n=1 Tax=Wickerhamomyces mucosus TaxID=1378264 RepID=A0A9P8PN29_9ASCO|nr:hypothetical protein WICMUC_003261 [Wickerhamomyces mucosus]
MMSDPRLNYVNKSEDFEKWLRMATDNKINSNNSWDLALIDYFHDLSLLREGDGINFQKASATLDGCVKIYSSRVDSAVTETGRLMNGLAASRARQMRENEGNFGEDDDEEDGDEGDEIDLEKQFRQKNSKRNTIKDSLVEFDAIKIKQMDLELYVDPLFKKALTDFDEGGSKSLLLNMLNVDNNMKIVFDTTDTAEKLKFEEDKNNTLKVEEEHENVLDDLEYEELGEVDQSFALMDIDDEENEQVKADVVLNNNNADLIEVNVGLLKDRFFKLDHTIDYSLCPSMAELRAVLNQETTSSELLKNLGSISIEELQEFSHRGDVDDFSYGAPDEDLDRVPIDGNNSKYPGNKTSIFFDDMDDEADDYGITMRMLFNEEKSFVDDRERTLLEQQENDEILGSAANLPDQSLLSYFDFNQRRLWAGPEHWKIQKLKKTIKSNPVVPNNLGDENANVAQAEQIRVRKPKEQFFIDFMSDDFPDEEIIFAESTTSLLLPRTQWMSKNKNVLPEDKHFTTRNFIYLFSKETVIHSNFNKVKNLDSIIDESLYAEITRKPTEIPGLNNIDFFHNDDDVHDFNDFPDDFGPDDDYISSQLQLPPSQLLAASQKVQPLSYSRVSKKVDVKLLKDNLWEALNTESSSRKVLEKALTIAEDSPTNVECIEEEYPGELKFSNVVQELSERYDEKSKKDLSTSFCFICLLHLANENGLTITNNSDNTDLLINDVHQPSGIA